MKGTGKNRHMEPSKIGQYFEKSTPMAITNFRKRRRDGSVDPILSDTDVEIAKEFVDDNKK